MIHCKGMQHVMPVERVEVTGWLSVRTCMLPRGFAEGLSVQAIGCTPCGVHTAVGHKSLACSRHVSVMQAWVLCQLNVLHESLWCWWSTVVMETKVGHVQASSWAVSSVGR